MKISGWISRIRLESGLRTGPSVLLLFFLTSSQSWKEGTTLWILHEARSRILCNTFQLCLEKPDLLHSLLVGRHVLGQAIDFLFASASSCVKSE